MLVFDLDVVEVDGFRCGPSVSLALDVRSGSNVPLCAGIRNISTV